MDVAEHLVRPLPKRHPQLCFPLAAALPKEFADNFVKARGQQGNLRAGGRTRLSHCLGEKIWGSPAADFCKQKCLCPWGFSTLQPKMRRKVQWLGAGAEQTQPWSKVSFCSC